MKKKNTADGVVYSTDPDWLKSQEPEPSVSTPEPDKQNLRIKTDKSGRAGKVVTLVNGFEGTSAELENLAKKLKAHCGTGGSFKDGQIIIQGECKEKILSFLVKLGYTKSKSI